MATDLLLCVNCNQVALLPIEINTAQTQRRCPTQDASLPVQADRSKSDVPLLIYFPLFEYYVRFIHSHSTTYSDESLQQRAFRQISSYSRGHGRNWNEKNFTRPKPKAVGAADIFKAILTGMRFYYSNSAVGCCSPSSPSPQGQHSVLDLAIDKTLVQVQHLEGNYA